MAAKHVVVQPYDEKWPIDFAEISAEIRDALGDLALSIEHVGSTSVPGLPAKPIIDIDVVIRGREALGAVIDALARIGYKHEGDQGIPGREAFKYEGKEHLRKHHLYVCAKDSAELKRHVAFRDYLRAHPGAVSEYGRIKEEGAALYPYDIDGYIAHKSPFIERIYREIGIDKLTADNERKTRYGLAVFDMDGTVLNTLRDLADAINYGLRSCGLPERTLEEARSFVGNGRRVLVERAVTQGRGKASPELLDRVYEGLDTYYRAHCRDNTRPYDGIPELLRALRESGVKTAVSTNKSHTEAVSLAGTFFPGLFDMSLGDREGQRRKPAPDGVFEIMRSLGVPKERTVYIGDSDVDIMTAKNANIDLISVCWGFRGEAFLRSHGAETIVRKPSEIFDIIV